MRNGRRERGRCVRYLCPQALGPKPLESARALAWVPKAFGVRILQARGTDHLVAHMGHEVQCAKVTQRLDLALELGRFRVSRGGAGGGRIAIS